MKLRNRIHIYSTLLMLVILIILTIVIYYSFSSLAYSTEVDELDSVGEALLRTFNANESGNPADVLRAYVPVSGLIKVTSPEGQSLESVQSPEITTQFPDQTDENPGTMKEKRFHFCDKCYNFFTQEFVQSVTLLI